jgi:hypothetical protein
MGVSPRFIQVFVKALPRLWTLIAVFSFSQLKKLHEISVFAASSEITITKFKTEN